MAYDLGIALVRLALSFHVFTHERKEGKKGQIRKNEIGEERTDNDISY